MCFPFRYRKAPTGIGIDLDFFLCSSVYYSNWASPACSSLHLCFWTPLGNLVSSDTAWCLNWLFIKQCFSFVTDRDLSLSAWIFSIYFSCWYISAQSSDLHLVSIPCVAYFFPRQSPFIGGHTSSIFPLLSILVSLTDLFYISHSFFLSQNSLPFSTLLTWRDDMVSLGACAF